MKFAIFALLFVMAGGATCLADTSLSVSAPTPISAGQSFALSSVVYQDTRTLNVYLPLGYEDSEVPYPVLYLLDGGIQQDYLPMMGMSAIGALSGQYRPFILVGIQSENRYYELTALSTVPTDVKAIANNGGAEEFRRFLRDEVKPWVAGNYRTSGEDAVIGESLAALFISETFLRAPQSFTHYIAVSPSLWWRNMGLSEEATTLLQATSFPNDRSFYLTVASEGGTMLEGVERLAESLKSQAPEGTRWWYEPMPDEHHHTIYNPATLRALRHVFAPQPEKASP